MKHRKEKFIERVKTSDDYINWLERFAGWRYSFTTNTEEDITEEDRVNIAHLRYFYEMIDEYAQENYYSLKSPFSYPITYHGNTYRIGKECDYEAGYSTYYYCVRQEGEEEGALAFEKIRSGEKLDSAVLIDQKLEELIHVIERLSAEGIPVSLIQGTTNNTIDKIRFKEFYAQEKDSE